MLRTHPPTIVFLCQGGFSSSTVVAHMKTIAERRGLAIRLLWGGVGEILEERTATNRVFGEDIRLTEIDVLLLTPHLRLQQAAVRAKVPQHVPVALVEGHYYSHWEELLDWAIALLPAPPRI